MMKTACASLTVLMAMGTASAFEPLPAKVTVNRIASQAPRVGPPQNFTGVVRIDSSFQAAPPARASGGIVTFDAGARSAWHVHPLGQTLIVTSGVGRVQQWGATAEEIRPGDTVWIPAGVKHWHGASPDAAMSHVAIVESLDGKSTVWMEKVSDKQYQPSRTLRRPDAAAAASPTPAQRMYGDISPKLAELTDKVLYGDVWERPALSKRDRSLITVSALIAMNRPDQLRSHLKRARDNGLTEAELVESITHLAFYAGWPNAVTAIAIAKEVFATKP